MIPPMRGLTLNLGGDRSTLQVSILRNDANRYVALCATLWAPPQTNVKVYLGG
jgi:hypothetical protein